MSRFTRGPALFLCLVLIFLALPLMAQVSQPNRDGQSAGNQEQPAAGSQHVLPVMAMQPLHHGVPWRDPNTSGGPIGFAAPAGAHLTYRGGPIISNVQVVQVLYGSGSYNSPSCRNHFAHMGQFYGDITAASGLTSLMQQYNTNISGGTEQVFGNGTFGGLFQIVPAAGNNGSTITDAQIQSEILSQITAGHLPAPVLDAAGQPEHPLHDLFPSGKNDHRRAEAIAARRADSAHITAPRQTCSAASMFCTA